MEQQVLGQLDKALTNGQAYTVLNLQQPLITPLGPGETIQLGYGTSTTQVVTVATAGAGQSGGDTAITVNSFNANANYARGTLIADNQNSSGTVTLAGTSSMNLAQWAATAVAGPVAMNADAIAMPTSGVPILGSALLGVNAAGTGDRLRTIPAAQATTGTGLLGAGIMGWDGGAYQRLSSRNTLGDALDGVTGSFLATASLGYGFNGTTSDRFRTAPAVGGVLASDLGVLNAGLVVSNGTHLGLAAADTSLRQLVAGAGVAGTPAGGVLTVQGGAGGTALPISSAAPLAANILTGYQTFTATTGATTLVTVPAGRTWVGDIGAACSCQTVAGSATAGQARAVFTIAGAGATPAAGTILAIEAKNGANAATGTAAAQGNNAAGVRNVTVIAPGGNAVTIQVASTNAGTTSVVDSWAIGALQ